MSEAPGYSGMAHLQHARTVQTLQCCRKMCVDAEPVKRFETLSYDAFCRTSSSVTGSLIHAMVGSFGGSGLRLWNRVGLVA